MTQWYVKTETDANLSVFADYAAIDAGGVLSFYLRNPTGGEEILVRAFAASQWNELTKAA